MISGLFQIFPGASIDATYAIDEVDYPGLALGDPGANQSLTVDLIEPNTEFEDYTTILQLRFSKVFTTSAVRTRVYMDANNIFNRARVTERNRFYGGGGIKNVDFLRVIGIESARVLSFGLQTSF